MSDTVSGRRSAESIGFVGLGNMGRPMAERLLRSGWDVSVYNRTAGQDRAAGRRGSPRARDAP